MIVREREKVEEEVDNDADAGASWPLKREFISEGSHRSGSGVKPHNDEVDLVCYTGTMCIEDGVGSVGVTEEREKKSIEPITDLCAQDFPRSQRLPRCGCTPLSDRLCNSNRRQ